MNEFYYQDEQNECLGPFPLSNLVCLMMEGKIRPSTLVMRNGETSWQQLSAVIIGSRASAPQPLAGRPSAAAAASPGGASYPAMDTASSGGYHNGMSLLEIFKLTMTRNYANFNGRATRREYWMFQLASALLVLAVLILGMLLMSDDESLPPLVLIFFYLYPIAVLIPSLGLTVRRLHDTGRSGWTLLLLLIPYAGLIFIFFVNMIDSQRGANAYGPSLKYPNG